MSNTKGQICLNDDTKRSKEEEEKRKKHKKHKKSNRNIYNKYLICVTLDDTRTNKYENDRLE